MNLIWKMLWPELRPHAKRMSLVVLFGILISATKMAVPELIRRLPEAWTAGDEKLAYQIPLLIAVVWTAQSTLRYFHLYWMLFTAETIGVSLRRKLMNKYLTLNLGFFQNFVRGSGGLISRMLTDINIIQAGFQKVADIVREPFTALFTFGYLVYLDWKLTLFILAGAPITTAVLRNFARSVRKYSRTNLEAMEDLTQILKESLDGTRVVQSFNLQNEMRHRFDTTADDFLSSRAKAISREEASGPVSEILTACLGALLLVYIGHEALGGRFAIGDFLSFVTAVFMLSDSVKKIQGGYIKIQQSAVALERLQSILDDKSTVPQLEEPKPFPEHWKEIEFRNVSFRYESTEVLKRINLTIRRGESVALVDQAARASPL